MAWRFDRAALERELAAAREEAQEWPDRGAYERLARAHLWLDEPEEAGRWFATALDAFRRSGVLERSGTASHWAVYGALLRQAGEPEAAREAFARSHERDSRSDHGVGEPQLRYLLGEGPLPAGREALLRWIRAERLDPSYTGAGLTAYDWLEETFRDSGLTHVQMLEQTGLLSREPVTPAEPAEPPAPGRWALTRTTPAGVTVEAYLEVRDDGYVTVCLDPSRERPLWVEAFRQAAGWISRIREGPADPAALDRLPTFGEAMDAARDMLWDEPWARETLDALLGRALGLPGGGVPEAR